MANKKTQQDIERIKAYIQANPTMVLVRNKHEINTERMLEEYPELAILERSTLYAVLKRVVVFDRLVRMAKEELRDEHKVALTADESLLLKILQQEVQLGLGYEPTVKIPKRLRF